MLHILNSLCILPNEAQKWLPLSVPRHQAMGVFETRRRMREGKKLESQKSLLFSWKLFQVFSKSRFNSLPSEWWWRWRKERRKLFSWCSSFPLLNKCCHLGTLEAPPNTHENREGKKEWNLILRQELCLWFQSFALNIRNFQVAWHTIKGFECLKKLENSFFMNVPRGSTAGHERAQIAQTLERFPFSVTVVLVVFLLIQDYEDCIIVSTASWTLSLCLSSAKSSSSWLLFLHTSTVCNCTAPFVHKLPHNYEKRELAEKNPLFSPISGAHHCMHQALTFPDDVCRPLSTR